MTIQWQAESNNASGATVTSLAINVPAGVVNGDLLIGEFACAFGSTITNPAGWTQISSQTNTDGTNYIAQTVCWKIASGEPASYTWTMNAATQCAGFIWRVTGANTSVPVDNFSANTGTGTSPSGLSITTVNNNTLLCHIAAVWSPTLTTWSAPAGMTTNTFVNQASGQARRFGASVIQAASGATGNQVSSTNGGVGDLWAVQLIAFAPAPATPNNICIANFNIMGSAKW